MSETIAAKKLLRRLLLKRRESFVASLSADQVSLINLQVSLKIKEYLLSNSIPQGSYISGFFPIRNEINILNILSIFQKDYKLCLPVHQRSELLQPLIFREYMNQKNKLIQGDYGILIPPQSAKIIVPSLILTPFLGFDPSTLHRIGYGGGHFDRTVSQLRLNQEQKSEQNTKFIGVGFSCQSESNLPIQESDSALDAVITEKQIYV